jgi:[acyl-carrier-protein] S-malonyltransferase
MGRALAQQFPVAAHVFAEADEVLNIKLSTLCFEGPDDELKLTTNAQPAIVTTSVAALRVLERETGIQPAYVAGHSLGEYSALVAAGVLTLSDAVRIVRERGRLMQEAVPVGVGAMAALFNLSTEEVTQVCADAAQGQIVSPANLNGG